MNELELCVHEISIFIVSSKIRIDAGHIVIGVSSYLQSGSKPLPGSDAQQPRYGGNATADGFEPCR